MSERGIRALALVGVVAAVLGVAFLFRSPAGSTIGTTAPLPALRIPAPEPLAEPTIDRTPEGFVNGFTAALNDQDLDRVLATLTPEVAVLYMPGVAGIEDPTRDEIGEAFESYRILDATLVVNECATQPGIGVTILDCTLTYNSNFARGIGLLDPQLFMRFIVGEEGIDAMYLSPFVTVDG